MQNRVSNELMLNDFAFRTSQQNWNDNSDCKPTLTQLAVNPVKLRMRLLSRTQHSMQPTALQLPVLVHLLSLMRPTLPTLLLCLLTVTTGSDLPHLPLSHQVLDRTLSPILLPLPLPPSQQVNTLRFNSLHRIRLLHRHTAQTLLSPFPCRSCNRR